MFNQNDKVIVFRYGRHKASIVERATKTQVMVDGKKYRQSDGGEVGGTGYSCKIMHQTEEALALVRRDDNELEHKVLIARVSDVKWRNLSKETLLAVLAIVEKTNE